MIFSGRIVDIVHNLIKQYVKKGSVVLDGTVGNGNDTIFLANVVGEEGLVYGFDIQEKAIVNTLETLKKYKLESRARLILDSHSNIKYHLKENIDFAVFNLGYLPGSDKNIITTPDTTLKALEDCLSILKEDGHIIITSYYGHEGGMEEKDCVEEFVKKLDNKYFSVIKFDFINKPNYPPIIYLINKIKR